ncbi:MAG: hypothetical protein IKL69_03840 [Paludibacteraceae bacterium]|nr:hypothetical protein [Paludibacteraceae bacterium]
MKKIIAVALMSIIMVACQPPYYESYATFSEIPLPEAGYLDEELLGVFKSDDIIFTSEWVSEYGGYSNGGIYPSSLNDSITTGIINQYS